MIESKYGFQAIDKATHKLPSFIDLMACGKIKAGE